MSLKPTNKNTEYFRNILSAKDWAQAAVGADKMTGIEGFQNFKTSGWYNPMHYRFINPKYPKLSPIEAIDEMAGYKQKLIGNVIDTAIKLDNMIMRLQKMEEEMKSVIDDNNH